MLVSAPSYALDFQEYDRLAAERTQLGLDESRLKAQTADLELLSAELGAIRSLQNDQLSGPHGLKGQYEVWLSSADAWLQQWKTLAAASKNVTNQNISTYGAELQQSLKQCNQTYAKLADQADVLYEKSASLAAQLSARPNLEPSRWGDKAEFVKALNEQKSRSLASLASLQKELNPKRVEDIRLEVAKVQSLIETRLSRMALEFPELRDKVGLIRSYLRFSAEVEPLIAQYESRGNRLIGLIDDGYLQIAQLELNALKKAGEPLIAKVRTFDGDEGSKSLLLKRLQQVAMKSEKALQEQSASGSRGSLFVNLVIPKRIALTQVCRDKGAQSLLDCELLRVLNQVPVNLDSIQKWTAADLQYFEIQLFKVENGAEKLPLGARSL